ncbi:hypothetical protein FKH18_25070 [Salmonella enterica]|uniref:Uncharacterized protein n=2 Tax=Salmonella enterica TaxID=28901 RepID=A0A629K8I1_SALER|nr:hypothetical protein [Salmonella enterica subsp. enterica serovar Java]EAN9728441.1 hypothetical protein [Salmonella enterica]ECW9805404.1 hypothetical protein [Salmonella enterica subsp. enterica serovar Poona]EDV9615027.1 hypothetical protein [Salmonella enterica subsp. enterica serovar Paratyphi B]EEM8442496.1 hypothetical protein [Salmonella enterica subsp. enterica serovar Oranienburg]EFV0933771.1 hypothetical protein [Salmonella enterica subsp. enterica serovar 4,[5],12:i:-]EHE861212
MAIYTGFNPPSQVKGLHVKGMITLGANEEIPRTLLLKLEPQNSTGLGSSSVLGNQITTQPAERRILDVVNTWLKTPLPREELNLILTKRDKFEFTIGTGDRRPGGVGRFRLITNWQGEDVTNLLLRPEPWDGWPPYQFRLSFSGATGMMSLTDSHAGGNMYGAMRYLTIRVKP